MLLSFQRYPATPGSDVGNPEKFITEPSICSLDPDTAPEQLTSNDADSAVKLAPYVPKI